MRDSIARALIWALHLIFPAHGRRRAIPAPLAPRPATVTVWSRPWTGPSAAEVRDIFHAEEAQAMTPLQRERWRAAAFHEIGVDYDFPTLSITGARRHGVAA